MQTKATKEERKGTTAIWPVRDTPYRSSFITLPVGRADCRARRGEPKLSLDALYTIRRYERQNEIKNKVENQEHSEIEIQTRWEHSEEKRPSKKKSSDKPNTLLRDGVGAMQGQEADHEPEEPHHLGVQQLQHHVQLQTHT